jgi:hypothetical protein
LDSVSLVPSSSVYFITARSGGWTVSKNVNHSKTCIRSYPHENQFSLEFEAEFMLLDEEEEPLSLFEIAAAKLGEALENRNKRRCHHHIGQHVSYLHPEKELERIKSSMAPPPPPAQGLPHLLSNMCWRESVLFTCVCVRGVSRRGFWFYILVSW